MHFAAVKYNTSVMAWRRVNIPF